MKYALVVLLMVPVVAFGGKKDRTPEPDPDHANHFMSPQPVEVDGITVALVDPWAREAQSKLKIEIQNHTGDYLLYKRQESRFVFPDGEFAPRDRGTADSLVVEPQDTVRRTLVVDGTGFHVDALAFTPSGLYRVAVDSPVVEAGDFQVPLSESKFDAGNFKCGVPGKVKQETNETKLRFECTYVGEAMGLVDASRIQVKLEDGQVFANDHRTMESTVVVPGDEFEFSAIFHVDAQIVDMQFATLQVVFNDTFREGEPIPVVFETMTMALDPALTATKND